MTTPGQPLHLHEDRLFASDPTQRAIARRLYAQVAGRAGGRPPPPPPPIPTP